MIKKIFVALILITAFNVNAQWVRMNNGIQTNNNVLKLAAFGNYIFAGSYNYIHSDAFVYLSTNSGVIWTDLNFPKRVFAFAQQGSNYFAGTAGYGVYITSNTGLNWTQCGLNNKYVYTLTCIGNNLFAGTQDSGVFVSGNNGTNWTHTSLNNQLVYSLVTVGNNIFAGTSSNGVLISTNYGSNWSQTSLANKLVYCLAASGNYIYASVNDSDGIYRSTNNGVNWTRTALYNKFIESIQAFGNNIFAAADNVGSSGGVYVSSNNGASWYLKNEGFNFIPSQIYALAISNNYLFAGTSRDSSVWRRPLLELVDIQYTNTGIPASYSLNQNYPNPFNPETKIRFALPEKSFVILKVYNVLGQLVEKVIDNKQLDAGVHQATFNGSRFASGIYFYRIETEKFTQTKRMVLLK